MSVKSGRMTGLITLTAATDITIRQSPSNTSSEFYNLVLTDTGGAGGTIDLFLSTDSTSAGGELIERITLAAYEAKNALPVGIPSTQYLIARASAGGMVAHGGYIYRDGGDV